ncbi:hypothetical protein [Autumnicola musiva]|uniref:Glycosyltransferase n=1 Tax=Autumnicola musiva TaxID=3075589 RepID=A0ABU3D2W6_9FLAO|nr:hypothetical protein [Zunongwangia sp. F117]MDT0675834.1 hypothetical protein [Zunongwangia sp. F117]
MKILFICPGLEPGKDGVGDYVSRIAINLLKESHVVGAIALHDPFISEIIKEKRISGKNVLQVLRIPSEYNTTKRMKTAADWTRRFEPEWVSLQYVGFGFNKYGLPLELLNLRKKFGDFKLHIMFHELWCGTPRESKIKEKILGTLQQIFIKRMAASLKPEEVFTNTYTSLKNLKKVGVDSKLTPVFSNIPIEEKGSDKHWNQMVKEKGLDQFSTNKEGWLIIGFFGTVYSYMNLKKLLVHAAIAASDAGRKLGILSIGHSRGQEIAKMAREFQASYWQTGILPSSLVNRAMQLVDLGVVTTRCDGLNKSGSALAWLERGIPVIISEEDETYNKEEMEILGVYQVCSAKDVWSSYSSKGEFKIHNNLKETSEAYARLESQYKSNFSY